MKEAYRKSMKPPLPDRLFSIAVVLPFVAAIAYLHYSKDVAFDCVILGSGSWGLGCALKLLLYHGFIRKLPHDSAHILGVSTLNGLVSGITELGVALLFFALLPGLSLWDVIAFGVGIGAIEAGLVATTPSLLQGTALEAPAAELEATVARMRGFRKFAYGYLLPFNERLIAAAIHVGTRGLVYVTYRGANPLPFVIALAAFVLADGVIGYRLIHHGRLADMRVLNRTYVALAGIALATLICFLLYWPENGYSSAATTGTAPRTGRSSEAATLTPSVTATTPSAATLSIFHAVCARSSLAPAKARTTPSAGLR